MKRIVLSYGLISGFIVISGFLLTVIFGIRPANGMVIGYTTMLLGFSLIYFAQTSLKKQQGGNISFGQAFKVGILISLIASAIYGLIWVILYNTILTDFAAHYTNATVEGMKKAGKSAVEIQKAVEQAQWFKENIWDKPVVNFLATSLMEPLPIGIIVTLIAALITRTRGKQYQPIQ
jgi:hypothetical protein